MKKANSLPFLSRNLLLASIAGLFTVQVAQATNINWTSTTTGTYNWSSASNWTALPNAASGDILTFNIPSGNVVSNIDSAWATTGSVSGLVFAADASNGSNYTYTFTSSTNTTLVLGADGITNYKTKGGVYLGNVASTAGTLVIGEAQTWKQSATGWNGSDIYINMNLSGTGNLTLTGSGGAYYFQNGNSTAYSGTMTLASSAVRLSGSSQLNRLGTTFNFGNGTDGVTGGGSTPLINIEGITGANQQLNFATNINFVSTGTANSGRGIQLYTPNATGTSWINFSGIFSGTMTAPLNFIGSVSSGTAPISNDVAVRITGNNSNWASTKGGGNQGNSGIWFQNGVYIIENANALGLGNTISFSAGANNGSTVQGTRASVLATDGITVASKIYANRNYQGTDENGKSNVVKVGLSGTGATSFSGTFTLETYDGGTTSLPKNRLPNVHLVAGNNGTATFSGTIIDSGTANAQYYDPKIAYAPVNVEGGGTIVLSGSNSYRGGTSIIGNTTLIAKNTQGSATGAGDLRVGYSGVTGITGSTTTNSPIITGVDTTNLRVGQTITGAGIPAGAIITYIHPTITGRIEISLNATATASGVSLSGNAETGILGGTGRIAPGGVNNTTTHRITVANGSSIAPGEIGAIGTLTLDGINTTAALLTMDAGSTFTFNLGLTGSSDQLAFWNYANGDFVLTNNVINFADVHEGTFTLFKFYSDNGITAANSGINSGLIIGTGLESYDYTLDYNADSITLTVVPEPATWAMMAGGLGLLALGQRFRRKSA